MSLVAIAALCEKLRDAPLPFFLKPITRLVAGKIDDAYVKPNFRTHFDFLENQLSTSPRGGAYFCGNEITEADILMSFPIEECISLAKLTPDRFPKICNFAELMKSRESSVAAQKRVADI